MIHTLKVTNTDQNKHEQPASKVMGLTLILFSDHESYVDCIDDENQKKIMPVLGCMLFWMSEDSQCSETIKRLPEHNVMLTWLIQILANSWAGTQG